MSVRVGTDGDLQPYVDAASAANTHSDNHVVFRPRGGPSVGSKKLRDDAARADVLDVQPVILPIEGFKPSEKLLHKHSRTQASASR